MSDSLESLRDLSRGRNSGGAPGGVRPGIPQCVCIYDAEGRCVLANSSLLHGPGREESTVLGQSFTGLWPGETATREAADLRLVLEGGRIEQVEARPGGPAENAPCASRSFPGRRRTARESAWWSCSTNCPLPQRPRCAHPETIGRLALGIVHDFNNALTLLRGQLSLVEPILGGARGGRETALDKASGRCSTTPASSPANCCPSSATNRCPDSGWTSTCWCRAWKGSCGLG